jgi:hypothetical protein
MAEATLKDVLKAIAQIRSEMATKDEVAAVRSEMATKDEVAAVRADVTAVRADVTAVRADVNAHRAETKKGFADLDKELTKHAEVHRELEKDVEALKRRPLRTAARAPRRRASK